MKRKELVRITEKYARSLERYSNRIPGAFTVEDIHDLRVDYKKLRAFIRLLREEKHTVRLQLSINVKDLYKAAGAVRDLQLFHARLNLYVQESGVPAPVAAELLQRQLFSDKELLVRKIEKVDWGREHKALMNSIPAVLHDASIRQFINRKVAAIHILQLVAAKEEHLHTMRKHFKDILYVVRVFHHDLGIPFPFTAWQQEELISDMAARLGDFNDHCITLAMLHALTGERLPEEEQQLLHSWQNTLAPQLEMEKDRLLRETKMAPLPSL